MGWLPPFLLPHKHYTISEIGLGIEKYVKGKVGYLKTFGELENSAYSLETLVHWVDAFASMANNLFRTASKLLAEFKPNWKPEKDKRLSGAAFPAAGSGKKNQDLNLLFQLFILREYFISLVEPDDFLSWLVFATRAEMKTTRFAAGKVRQIRNNSP